MTLQDGGATLPSNPWFPVQGADAEIDIALSFTNVTVRHAGRRILDDVSFAVRRGSTVALIGPTGAGKSTVIETALGLQVIDGGAIRLLGLEPGVAVASGRVGAVLASLGLPDGARVGDLLHFVSAIHASPLPMRDLVDRAGLGPLLDRSTDRLSCSQAEQVKLALALAGDPDLLLFDEPPAGQDGQAHEVLAVNLERFRQEGRTVLVAAEHLGLIPSPADHVFHIDRGRLHDEATTEAADTRPGEDDPAVEGIDAERLHDSTRPGRSR